MSLAPRKDNWRGMKVKAAQPWSEEEVTAFTDTMIIDTSTRSIDFMIDVSDLLDLCCFAL